MVAKAQDEFLARDCSLPLPVRHHPMVQGQTKSATLPNMTQPTIRPSSKEITDALAQWPGIDSSIERGLATIKEKLSVLSPTAWEASIDALWQKAEAVNDASRNAHEWFKYKLHGKVSPFNSQLQLSKSFSHALTLTFSDDFCFRVGRAKYFCSRQAAAYLSDKVIRLLVRNPKASTLVVRTPDEEQMFALLIRFVKTGTLDVSGTWVNVNKLLELAEELECREVRGFLICYMFAKERITSENVFARIVAKKDKDASIEDEVEFLAVNFNEAVVRCPKNAARFFGMKDVAGAVVQHRLFLLECHDDFVELLLREKHSDKMLLQYVDFVRLKVETMKKFVSEFRISDMTPEIWMKVTERLAKGMNEVTRGKKFEFNSGRPLDGIIAHLTRMCGGNVHLKGLVEVTTSSNDGAEFHPWSIADLGTSSRSRSRDEPNQWLCYDFKDRSVCPTSYTIRTYDSVPGSCHLKSWVLEGTNDCKDKWVILDRRENNRELNNGHAQRNFAITSPDGTFYRFLRLRQTGKSHYGNDRITITSLEIFGNITNVD